MKLSADQLSANYQKLMELISTYFKDRNDYKQVLKLYKDYEERLVFSPASAIEHYHNAWIGGYCDHVIRVMEFSKILYKLYEKLGLVLNFTLEELLFAALNHDLGKLGLPGNNLEGYVPNESEWHRKNQGKMFDANKQNDHMLVQDRSLFILQYYGITLGLNEYIGIRIHDGMYDDANTAYLLTSASHSKLRSNLPLLLHQADMLASRKEWETWAIDKINLDKTNLWDIADSTNSKTTDATKQNNKSAEDEFNEVFKV